MAKADIFGNVIKTYTERWANGNGETKQATDTANGTDDEKPQK